MEDERIVQLFWQRDESAVACAAEHYGAYLSAVARRILGDRRDAEECLNSTLEAAWRSIPPHRPMQLKLYLAKLTRRISLDLCRKRSAAKRGGGPYDLALEELEECISAGEAPDRQTDRKLLAESIQAFLAALPTEERRVFLLRYWHMYSVGEVAQRCGYSRSKTASMLHRTRLRLKEELLREELL